MNFDEWRAAYDTLTDEEHAEAAQAFLRDYAEKDCFNLALLAPTLARLQLTRIIEVGGGSGRLARLLLEGLPTVRAWVNYELIYFGGAFSSRYQLRDRPRLWEEKNVRGDVLLFSHSAEHLRLHQILGCVRAMSELKHLVILAPLPDEPPDWSGYQGTHILEVGWDALTARLALEGFEVLESITGRLDDKYPERLVRYTR